jgi:hypothetical protein
MNAPPEIWVFTNDPSNIRHFEIAARFYGLVLRIKSPDNFRTLLQPDPTVIIAAIDAGIHDQAEVANVLGSHSRHWQIPLAIYNVRPGNERIVSALFDGALAVRAVEAMSSSSLAVHAETASEVGYELRGLRFPLPAPGSCTLVVTGRLDTTALASCDYSGSFHPVLFRARHARVDHYITGGLPASPELWPSRGSHFAEIAPFLLLIKSVAGRRGWSAPLPLANLTIDDPWLREPYGCLSYKGLLQQMRVEKFHTTIGFVPWNYDRSWDSVIKIFKENPSYYSVAIHGNNHDRYEFFRYQSRTGDQQRPKPFQEQQFNVRQAMARMEAFASLTGLAFDRVMVFPHGVSPAATIAELKRAGYWATSNYSNVPLDESPPMDPVRQARASTDSWSGFPTLRRAYPQNYSEASIAIDLFLGNPVLFMAHQDLFFDGIDAFNRSANMVNTHCPEVQWASLGKISRYLYLQRFPREGHVEVELQSRRVTVHNAAAAAQTYHFCKYEPTEFAISDVWMSGERVNHERAENEISFSVTIPPQATVEMEIRGPVAQAMSLPIRRSGFRNHVLRFVSDFRDLQLSGTNWGKQLTRKYYRRGKKRLTVSGIVRALVLGSPRASVAKK